MDHASTRRIGAPPGTHTASRYTAAASRDEAAAGPYIFIACPWTPVGGGMYKVADYLIQAQDRAVPVAGSDPAEAALPRHARLRPLDTRGARGPLRSLGVLAGALLRLARGRWSGQLAGVHVNMAERLSLVRKGVVVVACRALGVPVVLHLHAAQLHRAWPRLPGPLRAGVRWMFSLPRCCIVLGRESADFVTRALRVPAERVEIVTNGVPEPLPAPVALAAGLRRARAGDGAMRLLFVGNLSARKGVPELLQAMATAPLAGLPVRLSLAGGGDLATYRAIAGRLGLGDRVCFEGWADGPRLARLMAQADALVLPSHDEGLPLVILEALAAGLPVVCTPVGEIPHTLRDGVHARFVPPGDPAALARVLAGLAGDAPARAALARSGRELYARAFAMPRYFDRIAAIHARHFGVAARRDEPVPEAAP